MTAQLLWLVILVPLAVALGTQLHLRSVYSRYREVRNHSGLTGAEVARELLDAHDLDNVRIAPAQGELTDQYDGETKTLSLSIVPSTCSTRPG